MSVHSWLDLCRDTGLDHLVIDKSTAAAAFELPFSLPVRPPVPFIRADAAHHQSAGPPKQK
jgi:hypothetical protein